MEIRKCVAEISAEVKVKANSAYAAKEFLEKWLKSEWSIFGVAYKDDDWVDDDLLETGNEDSEAYFLSEYNDERFCEYFTCDIRRLFVTEGYEHTNFISLLEEIDPEALYPYTDEYLPDENIKAEYFDDDPDFIKRVEDLLAKHALRRAA